MDVIRHAGPDDIEAIQRTLSGPRARAGTLPLQSVEGIRKRLFSETREGLYHLVARVDEEVVGHPGLETLPR
ncbi:MAG: hypothetical protein M3358_01845 [Actinomycetota bacterium]|jgi:hypothetical protein|nr:hypothetical protein [Actinomycetota bacterium]